MLIPLRPQRRGRRDRGRSHPWESGMARPGQRGQLRGGGSAGGRPGETPGSGRGGYGHGTRGGSGSGMLPPRCREPNPWRLPQLPRRSLPHGRSRGPALPPSASPAAAEPRYWLLPARRRPPSPGPGRGRGVRAHGSAYKGAAPQPPGSFWSRATGAAGRGVSPGEDGSGGERRPPCMARDYERR